MKKHLIDFYLDFVNNYLTVGKIAEHHGLTIPRAVELLAMGGRYHEEAVEMAGKEITP